VQLWSSIRHQIWFPSSTTSHTRNINQCPSIPPSRTSITSLPRTSTPYVCYGTNIRPLLLKRSTPFNLSPLRVARLNITLPRTTTAVIRVVLHCPCDPPSSQRIHPPGVTRLQPGSKRLVPRSTYGTYQCPPTYIITQSHCDLNISSGCTVDQLTGGGVRPWRVRNKARPTGNPVRRIPAGRLHSRGLI